MMLRAIWSEVRRDRSNINTWITPQLILSKANRRDKSLSGRDPANPINDTVISLESKAQITTHRLHLSVNTLKPVARDIELLIRLGHQTATASFSVGLRLASSAIASLIYC